MKTMAIAAAVLLGLAGGGVYFLTKAEQIPVAERVGGPQGTAAKQVAAMAQAPSPAAKIAGEWAGKAPWASSEMSFSIAQDGTFTALDTRGTWTEAGGLYTLKFADDHTGARYEGRIFGDVFSGTAFSPEGEQKPFSMARPK